MIVCLDANIVNCLVEQNPLWEPKVSARIAAYLAAGEENAMSDVARAVTMETAWSPKFSWNPFDHSPCSPTPV
jgi:hypothetical protein